jgi:hypothetical protein
MTRFMQTVRKFMNPYLWWLLPPEVVYPEPLDSSSDFDDEVPEIIEVSSDSDVEEFLEFELVTEVEPVMDLVRPSEVDFKDPEADKPRKKQRIEGNDSDTSDAFGNYEIVDLTGNSEDEEEDLYAGKDPYMFIRDLTRDSGSD